MDKTVRYSNPNFINKFDLFSGNGCSSFPTFLSTSARNSTGGVIIAANQRHTSKCGSGFKEILQILQRCECSHKCASSRYGTFVSIFHSKRTFTNDVIKIWAFFDHPGVNPLEQILA